MLARDLVEPTADIYAEVESGDDLTTIKNKVFQANAQALRDTIEVLDDADLERAVAPSLRRGASTSTASAAATRWRSMRTTSSSSSAWSPWHFPTAT